MATLWISCVQMGTYTGDKEEAVKKHCSCRKPGMSSTEEMLSCCRTLEGIWLLELPYNRFLGDVLLYSCNCRAHNFFFHLQVSAGSGCRVCLIAYLVIPLVFAFFSFLLARVGLPLVLKFLRDRGHNYRLCFSPALLVCGVRRMNIYYHFVDIIKW